MSSLGSWFSSKGAPKASGPISCTNKSCFIDIIVYYGLSRFQCVVIDQSYFGRKVSSMNNSKEFQD